MGNIVPGCEWPNCSCSAERGEPCKFENPDFHINRKLPELIVTRGDGKALPDQPAAIREFIAASVRPTPFTTADLPPIRLDMSAPAIRARVVREALADLAMIVERDANGAYEVRLALAMLAEFADDATLDRLARMVR